MRNPLLQFWFLISLGLYLVLFVLKQAGIYLPYLSDYAADLLTMPVVLSIALWAIRISGKERRAYTLSWTLIVLAVVMYAVLFEVVFPGVSDRATADPWDVVAYALGAGFFAWRMNRA